MEHPKDPYRKSTDGLPSSFEQKANFELNFKLSLIRRNLIIFLILIMSVVTTILILEQKAKLSDDQTKRISDQEQQINEQREKIIQQVQIIKIQEQQINEREETLKALSDKNREYENTSSKSSELIAKVLDKIDAKGDQLNKTELKAAITTYQDKFTSKELEYLRDLSNNFNKYDVSKRNGLLDEREIALAIYR